MKAALCAVLILGLAPGLRAADQPGPFFEPGFPFYQTHVDLREKAGPLAENFVVRGLVLPLGTEHALAFDQDLLRVAGVWAVPAGQPPVTLANMAQVSYAEPHRKSGADHSKPAGPVAFANGLHPGVALSAEELRQDPRTPNPSKDLGRGPLPAAFGRFEGVEDAGAVAVLHYRVGGVAVREWHEVKRSAGTTIILRHFAVGPQPEPLFFSIAAGAWTLRGARLAEDQGKAGGALAVSTNADAFTLTATDGGLIARLAPAPQGQRVTLALILGPAGAAAGLAPTPETPAPDKTRRWPQSVTTRVQLDSVKANGLALDRIALPETNPWKRRVRSADLVFLTPDRAAVVTYDGDVWLAGGLAAAALPQITWQRFASGLHEPLAMALAGDLLQIATKNGLVRLHDRDRNGEADWYENFSDAMRQSQSTRSFPLDMDLGPDGSTYVTAGGIALGGAGTPFSGGIARIAPDGRTAELIATAAREPYVTVHPRTGLITGTDQQGHFVPSSVCYLIRPGDDFGFGKEKPAKLTPPLVWIPHTEDNSSASQVWLTGEKLGPFREQLLHLSYGNGGLFLICPDLAAPVPQGAVIPLGMDTQMPLLQGRMHPAGASVFLTGFQIYDSRAPQLWALARLRLSDAPVTSPVGAQSCPDGVILRFASPLKAESVRAEQIVAQAWNYRRSKEYGSGRFMRDGQPGMDAIGVSQAVLSPDRRAVFIHLPGLAPVMQLEVRHAFQLESGAAAEGVTYFTVHAPSPLDLARAGFPGVDLTRTKIVSQQKIVGPATLEMGRTLSVSIGCIACHSVDGTTEGKTGPTWKGLFGRDREFADGSVESANEFYLCDSILVPEKKIVKGFVPGMPSYKGVLTPEQIEAIILYIQSLK